MIDGPEDATTSFTIECSIPHKDLPECADPEFSNDLIGDGLVTDLHITGIHIEGNLARDVAPLYCQFHYLKALLVPNAFELAVAVFSGLRNLQPCQVFP